MVLQKQKNAGDLITVELFAEGDLVDVSGISKGKGFQGVVKRHGFSGVGGQTHGQHDRNRAPGSLGNSSYASRVVPGMRMAGRTGGNNVKTQNLTILKVMPEKKSFDYQRFYFRCKRFLRPDPQIKWNSQYITKTEKPHPRR